MSKEKRELESDGIRLTIELVPRSCMYTNVRSEVSDDTWSRYKGFISDEAGARCEICGGRGPKWPVECHEVWSYLCGVQKLERLIALCPSCHEVKHIGHAHVNGRFDEAREHLMKVNRMTPEEADRYIGEAFEGWGRRSESNWILDISYLEKLEEDIAKPKPVKTGFRK